MWTDGDTRGQMVTLCLEIDAPVFDFPRISNVLHNTHPTHLAPVNFN